MGLWTRWHVVTLLPTLVLMIIIATVMRRLLINKPFDIRMIPIKIISLILIVLEIIKQVYSIKNGYDPYHLPLHFCSIFLYALPLMAFYRGKYQNGVRSVATSTMTALFIGMLVIPNVIYSEDRIFEFFSDYLAFQTVSFHNLVIFALFITLALDLHKPTGKRGEVYFIAVFGIVFVTLSATMSHLLETNFSNFLYSTVGFIKDIVDALKVSVGETTIKVIYTITLALLHVLLMVGTNYLYLFVEKCKEKAVAYFAKNK